jgi:hypothetical protein
MATFRCTATFDIEADSLDDAQIIWDEDGPECAWRVDLVDAGNLYEVEDGEPPLGVDSESPTTNERTERYDESYTWNPWRRLFQRKLVEGFTFTPNAVRELVHFAADYPDSHMTLSLRPDLMPVLTFTGGAGVPTPVRFWVDNSESSTIDEPETTNPQL